MPRQIAVLYIHTCIFISAEISHNSCTRCLQQFFYINDLRYYLVMVLKSQRHFMQEENKLKRRYGENLLQSVCTDVLYVLYHNMCIVKIGEKCT